MTKKSTVSNAAPAAQSPTHHKRRIPGVDPAPEMRLFTVAQIEEAHPALKGRVRAWVHRSDADDPDFAGLNRAVVRVGRSVFIDEVRFREFLYQRSAMAPAPSRRDPPR